jgi:hypothetical protein
VPCGEGTHDGQWGGVSAGGCGGSAVHLTATSGFSLLSLNALGLGT